MDSNSTVDQSIQQIIASLPPVIRNYLTQKRHMTAVRNLMSKYDLRLDQGGVLEKEVLLLLMGVHDPDEFVGSLMKDAGIEGGKVSGIAKDVNDQIFVPLRDEERRTTVTPATPDAPRPMSPRPVMPQPQPQPSGPRVYMPPPQSPMYPSQPMPEPSITFTRPLQKTQLPATPASRPPISALKEPAPRQQPPPSAPQITNPDKLLEDHEEPHIELGATPTPQPAPAAPPPPNLPGVPPSAPPQAGFPPKRPAPPAPPSYSVDPYREPLDENP